MFNKYFTSCCTYYISVYLLGPYIFSLGNFAAMNGKLYCKPHFLELFKSGGGEYKFINQTVLLIVVWTLLLLWSRFNFIWLYDTGI